MSARIGALFAGYGGLDMAVSEVFGAEMVWYSEVDKGALKILGHRFPDVPNVGDVTTADWSQVEPVDILTGGSPCQDLSHAGKRQGMTEGTRSNLWVAMREAIAQLRPATVVWENVRGAYSAEADSDLESDPRLLADVRRRDGQPVLRALGRVLGDLSDLGYDCRWHGLRAADVGAPHGRFRVFVVATDARHGAEHRQWARSESRQGGEVTPIAADLGHERSGRARDGRTGSANGGLLPTPSVADALGGHERRGGARGNELLLNGVAKSLALLPTPTVQDGSNTGGASQFDRNSVPLNALVTLLPTPSSMTATSDPGSTESWLARRDRMLERGINGNGISTPLGIAIRLDFGQYAAAIARWEHILGRPAPAPTMTSTKGNPQLSPVFVEWLMGLPAGWVTDVPGITRNEALKALGNGVVPQQAAAALRTMLAWEVAA